jgi:predicted TIM-barrel fold metal-dependent hydrolase
LCCPPMAPAFPIVDAHQHFWNLSWLRYPWLQDAKPIPFRYGDTSALHRTYLPADYRADSADQGIVKTVHMEAECDPRDPVGETLWLEEVAAAHGIPNACVAQAWLDREDVAEVLAAQAAHRLVRGVRHKPRAAASPGEAKRGEPGSMDDDRWRRGYARLERHGLSFDLQTPWWHLEAAADLARDFPKTTLILNHTGLPANRSAEGLAAWRRALEVLAGQPNAVLKISGLGQRDRPWTLADNGPVIRTAIEVFGADRCMFASNYPVDSLTGSFGTIYAGFRAAVADLPQPQQKALFHDNAVRVYRL